MRHCWGTTTMPHTRSGHDQDRSRNMRTRNRRLGPLVQHPPPPLPGRHNTTTSRIATHNNTKGSGLNKPPQNPGLGTPAKGHCTRYVALHRVQCLHIGCTTPRHKLRCGPARMEVDGSARLACTRQRTPNNQQDPAATHPQTANRARQRTPTSNRTRQQRTPNNQQGPRAAGPDRPSRRRAERAARGARAA